MKHQQGNVFQPQFIVTQTEGMNNWLKLQIAANNDITANCLFVSPNEIIQKVYYFLEGKSTGMLSAQNLTWLLYTILGEKDFIRRFENVASYYSHNGPDKDLKRMALAEKNADLFDQYQVYRPEWIELWNNEPPDEPNAGNWQRYLWTRAKQLSRERLPDKTVIGKYIRDTLKDQGGREKLKAKMPSLHVFGLSITTDYHLQLLFEISKAADVSFHLVNPAPSVYWFEDRSEKQLAILKKKGLADKNENSSGNPLLTSWGRVIQDTFMLLFKNEELLNSFEEVSLEEPPQDTLLHKIQNDIYHGMSKEDRNVLSLADVYDGSVTISSCYSIAREVEVLYNYLVHLVDQRNENLSPREIVVMVTDIDAYAPYIKAVFKNAPHQFHFTIADESFAHGDTIVNALTSILTLNRVNFKAEEVLRLLDSGYIRKRFGLTDLDLVRKIVDAANIRFGIKGSKEDDTRFVSWEYGIKRIMYGVCMSGDEEYYDPDGELLFPLDMSEGSESAEVIRFYYFIQVLIDSVNDRDSARTIAEWVDYTERLIQNLICEPEEEVEEDYILLQAQLANLNTADELMEEKIAFDVFMHSLLKSVSVAVRSGSFAGGGITFCSLIPMRSIPFKIVALLGLNFDKFPRKESASSFNLIEKDKRRRGDRNVKENDKHLFLETVLSASRYLYISYLGMSTKDNTTIPPSALVDELIDYIEAGCDEAARVRAALTIRHPLHSFSAKYNKAMPGYFNYLDSRIQETVQITDDQKHIEAPSFDEITMESLISFVRHPVKTYYNKVLDIRYNEAQALLSDTEVFSLDKLQEWSLKPQLLAMKKQEVENLKKRLVRTGGLPLKNMADVAIDNLDEEVNILRDLFSDCIGDAQEHKVLVEMTIDNSRFKGTLQNIYDKKLVFVSYSRREMKHLLDAYIRYLTAAASELNCRMYFISAAKRAVFAGKTISHAEARQKLTELVQLYKRGHKEVVAFFPGFDIKPADVENLDEKILFKIFEKFFHNFEFPCDDQYLLNEYQKGFFHSGNIVQHYQSNAQILIEPLGDMFPGYFQE